MTRDQREHPMKVEAEREIPEHLPVTQQDEEELGAQRAMAG
jgi:hypothetical protein